MITQPRPDRPTLLHITTVPMSLTFLRGQVGFMKDRGFTVHAISSPGPDLNAFEAAEGVGTKAISMSRRITPFSDLRAVTRLTREIGRLAPTIVHAHTPKAGLLGMIAATARRTPVRIYHMRGLPLMGTTGARRAILERTERLACRLAHQVLCVSPSIREEAIRQGLCPDWKIRVLCGGSGNGVDSDGKFDPAGQGDEVRRGVRERLGIPRDSIVIGFVGRLVRDKGLRELATAWRHLRFAHENLHLLAVGPFEEEDPVPVATRRELQNDPRVHLVGMDWDTPPYYAAMDVVVLPTYREGFPNVPLEAAAMGLPVVATRVPGCVDAVLDGRTGILVQPRDAGGLQDAILQYIRDPELRMLHGAAGRDRVRREFRQETIWGATFELYASLMRARGIPCTEEALTVPLARSA